MNKLKFLFVLAITLMAFTSCEKNDSADGGQGNFNRASSAGVGADSRSWPSATATIPSTINGGTVTLTNDKVWILDGPTYVGSTGILKIQPNTLIKGKSNPTNGVTSYLVVTRGGKIEADGGSAATSIVFTSDKAANNRQPGDWGGLIVLGDAPTNQSNPQIEGVFPTEVPSGYSINYGGGNAAHNGGIIRFVRIEFGGRNLGDGNEINGLTLGGVGAGTTLENIQVSYGLDDGFEFFGGTVNAKNLISFGNTDDDFDFDFGYIGNIQFAVALRDPSVQSFLSSDPNGIESDNNSAGSTITPRTHPVLSNFTILGYKGNPTGLLNGVRFRRASQFELRNSLIAGWNNSGAFFDGTATLNDLISGTSTFKNNAVQGAMDDINPNPLATWVGYANNSPLQLGTSPSPTSFVGLANPFFVSNPNFGYVNPASPAASNYNYIGLPAFFNTTLTYRGAFGPVSGGRWDDFWASYQPKTNAY